MRVACIILAVSSLGACAGPGGHDESPPVPRQHAPGDFAVAITIYSPVTDPAGLDTLPVRLRPSRYVLEPDGALRAQVRPRLTEDDYPPRIRQLSGEQVDRIWRLVSAGPFADPDEPTRVGGPMKAPPAPDRTDAVISIADQKSRRFYRVNLLGASEPSRAAAELIERLAQLTWLE
jgi:hypothetical protein